MCLLFLCLLLCLCAVSFCFFVPGGCCLVFVFGCVVGRVLFAVGVFHTYMVYHSPEHTH